jgi:conserved hypothetical protein, cofD-related
MNKNMSTHKSLKLVSIGSVSAASLLIKSFPECKGNLTAIVPTTDTGSSTGIIRNFFSLPAPGDVRAVLAAMADEKGSPAILKKLFDYRFNKSQFKALPNMALGNLILAALSDIEGSFAKAVKVSEKLLGVKGKVLPVTTTNTNLKAVLKNGKVVRGEKEVRRPGKPPIEKIFLEESSATLGAGIPRTIMEADMILIGPGCLYTSVIACLLVPGLSDLLNQTKAKKIYCGNTTTTPGQTDGLTIVDHVNLITRYLDNHPPDYVLVNNKKPRPAVVKAYQRDNIRLILPTPQEIEKIKTAGIIPIVTDLIEENWTEKRKLHKLDTIRHNPQKVRKALLKICYK